MTMRPAEILEMFRYCLRSMAVRKAAYAFLASLAVLMLVASAWWWPASHERKSLLREIDERRAEAVASMRAVAVAHLQREAKQAVPVLEKKLTVYAGQADLIQGIAKLATKHGVRVVSQTFDEGKSQGGEAPLYMEVGLTGSYAGLRKMMGRLATLPMWLEVVEARMDHSGDDGSIRAQLRLLTYRAPRART